MHQTSPDFQEELLYPHLVGSSHALERRCCIFQLFVLTVDEFLEEMPEFFIYNQEVYGTFSLPAKPYNHLLLSMSLIVVFWYARTRIVVRDVFDRNP